MLLSIIIIEAKELGMVKLCAGIYKIISGKKKNLRELLMLMMGLQMIYCLISASFFFYIIMCYILA
jgi:hypothetical protein